VVENPFEENQVIGDLADRPPWSRGRQPERQERQLEEPQAPGRNELELRLGQIGDQVQRSFSGALQQRQFL
jgi:hypothetical protein